LFHISDLWLLLDMSMKWGCSWPLSAVPENQVPDKHHFLKN
jgi:hypothetical protein